MRAKRRPDKLQQRQPSTEILDQAGYEALANLRYALRRFSAFSADAAHAAGLPPQQHQALLAIKGTPPDHPVTIGLLAQRLLIAPHTATELVGRLLEADYVVRTADPADKRRHTLELTPKAEAALAELSDAHLREIREMAPQLIEALQVLARDAGRD
jgi:DNA-binding MarR family transcriptional regulator